jgi:hypothetical protein
MFVNWNDTREKSVPWNTPIWVVVHQLWFTGENSVTLAIHDNDGWHDLLNKGTLFDPTKVLAWAQFEKPNVPKKETVWL